MIHIVGKFHIFTDIQYHANTRVIVSMYYHAFIAAVKRAKISDYAFHDLRHESLSRLSERGDLSMLEIADISGHKTLKMLQRYTHLQDEDNCGW